MQIDAQKNPWQQYSERLTPQRRERLLKAASERTRFLRLVVQDIHHPHNVAACLRSAEAFGIQEVDVVNVNESFKQSTVAAGVYQWLEVKRWHAINDVVKDLRNSGYLIAGAYPDANAVTLDRIPLDRPLAVVFANEFKGAHPDWLPEIDLRFTIPMYGLVQSFNISVSCAVTLYDLVRRARSLCPEKFFLSQDEQQEILNEWVKRL